MTPRSCEWCGGINDRPRSRWCCEKCKKARWYAANPDYNRQYHSTNRESVREKKRAYNVRTAEQNRARARVWQLANPERSQERSRNHYLANRAEYMARARAWGKAHPEVISAGAANRRARRIGADGVVSDHEWAEILAWADYRCVYCATGDAPMTRDHVFALSSGGRHAVDNLVPACNACNASKSSTPIREWAPDWDAPFWIQLPTEVENR